VADKARGKMKEAAGAMTGNEDTKACGPRATEEEHGRGRSDTEREDPARAGLGQASGTERDRQRRRKDRSPLGGVTDTSTGQ
jgi:hypothetical protein